VIVETRPPGQGRARAVVVDGSYGEGGGQILRTSLALAVLVEQPVRVERIRAGRRHPGLRPQHLTAVRAGAAICHGRLEGDILGSEIVTLIPGGPARPGEYRFDVADAVEGGSAGSVGLILQTVLFPLALSEGVSTLTLRGGTHVPWAPSASYLEHVFLPTVATMGVHGVLDAGQWGFYPAGGGSVHVRIQGGSGPLTPIVRVERGDVKRVWGVAAVTNLPAHIAQRMANRAENVLNREGLAGRVEACRLRSVGPGAGIFLFVEYETGLAGFTAYGRKGLPAERVAETACEGLLQHHRDGAPIDPQLADQLVLPMALANGESRLVTSQVTQHLLTNVWAVQQFLACEVTIEGQLGERGVLVVRGGGHD